MLILYRVTVHLLTNKQPRIDQSISPFIPYSLIFKRATARSDDFFSLHIYLAVTSSPLFWPYIGRILFPSLCFSIVLCELTPPARMRTRTYRRYMLLASTCLRLLILITVWGIYRGYQTYYSKYYLNLFWNVFFFNYFVADTLFTMLISMTVKWL